MEKTVVGKVGLNFRLNAEFKTVGASESRFKGRGFKGRGFGGGRLREGLLKGLCLERVLPRVGLSLGICLVFSSIAFSQQGSFGQGGSGQGGLGGSFGQGYLGQEGAEGGLGQEGLGGLGQGGSGQGGGDNNGGFVGSSSADVENFFQSLGRNQENRSRSNRRSNRSRRNNRNSRSKSSGPLVRVKLTVDFEDLLGSSRASHLSRPAISSQGLQSLEAALARRGVRMPQIRSMGRTVTLTGSVRSEKERRLIKALISLEPGVGKIVNEIRVERSASAEILLPKDN